MSPAQTLSLCILTKDSGSRLADLIGHGRTFADEIVVGIDVASTDATFDVAAERADVVFQFEHTGLVGPARNLPLEFATSEWILSLDDDERMDSAFRELRPSLLDDERYTHYWFPRKWLVRTEPPVYLNALPWFPDWQPRLFKNDRRLVWSAPVAHDSYQVVGTGCYEDRTAVIHYERLYTTEPARRGKVLGRRGLEGRGRYEEFYRSVEGVSTALLENPPGPERRAFETEPAGAKIMEVVQPVNQQPVPPWRAEIFARAPETVQAGAQFLADVEVTNKGSLRWVPPAERWPRLYLSYHLRNARDEMVRWDGERTPVGRVVDPGESLRFLAVLNAPGKRGDYVLEWDLVSEGECWFATCGSSTARTTIRVTARD